MIKDIKVKETNTEKKLISFEIDGKSLELSAEEFLALREAAIKFIAGIMNVPTPFIAGSTTPLADWVRPSAWKNDNPWSVAVRNVDVS